MGLQIGLALCGWRISMMWQPQLIFAPITLQWLFHRHTSIMPYSAF